MAKIYPRLQSFEYEENIKLAEKQIKENNFSFNMPEEKLQWLPVGTRVTYKELQELRKNIINFVSEHKITRETPGTELIKFDRELGIKLVEWLDITPSIAADNGMWAFLNIVLIPDVVFLRWDNDNAKKTETSLHARFYNPRRSYLKSLWFTATLIHDPALFRTIPQDAIATWYDKALSRGYDNYINVAFKHFVSLSKENEIFKYARELFRKYLQLVNKKLGYLNYYALTPELLNSIFDEAFNESLKKQNL